MRPTDVEAEAIHLLADNLAGQALTAVEENTEDDPYAIPLVLYLVAAKLRAAADIGRL